MEALAAIGLASNLLQFVELGYKVMSTAREMYGTGKEASRANKDIEFITQDLKSLSIRLSKHAPTSTMTEDERSLLKLTEECQKWSDEMLSLLEYLKNGNPNSKIGAVKAAVRNYKKKGEKERLIQGLNNCRNQLDLQLTSMSRSEILDKIRDLAKSTSLTNKDLIHFNKSVEILQQSLQTCTASMSSRSQKGLGELLQASDQTLINYKQGAVLRALRFEGMRNRFHDVETAHETTFEWLLEAPGHNHSDSTFRVEARERFTNWLQRGSGIFHISGKPGAGKSTLMKFLCKNQLTRRYLEIWSNGKALVLAKAFFWRLGNDNQKSLSGLIRTLLYEVLSAVPALVPIMFPSHWGKVDTYPTITLEPDEIEQAFINLTTNQAIFEECKIVFLIDGLDEYEGRHSELVKKFFIWTSINPENIKICVASREWNEFTIGFAGCPNLRIHECTHEDITAFIRHRIKTCCEDSDAFSQGSLELLVNKITSKAEGVFQWVRLALNATEDGIFNGDSMSDLEAKINAFPKELVNLYQHLFDSIHVSDRRKVFETLRMASHMGSDYGLRLLQFWFLNEAIADPHFATKMPITEASEEDLTKILKTTRRQIYGRCKGLLEVYPLEPPENPKYDTPQRFDTFIPLPSDGKVRFMHSTAYEFLNRDHIKQEIDYVVGHVDFFHRICQTFLASIKFAKEAWYFHHHADGADSQYNNELNDILLFALKKATISARDSETCQSKFQFPTFLNQTEIVTMARLRSTYQYMIYQLGDMVLGAGFISSPTYVHTSPQTHIISLATSHCIHEFLRGKDMTYLESMLERCESVIPGNNDSTHSLALLLFSNHAGMPHYGQFIYNRLCDMLELCFSRGISPNLAIRFKGPTLFDYMLMLLIFYGSHFVYDIDTPRDAPSIIYPVRLLELCLRYGAKSQLRLCFGPIYRHRLTNTVHLNAAIDLGPAFSTDEMIHRWEIGSMFSTVSTSPIALFAKQRDWVVTLQDLAELWAPDHHRMLQDLLDRNNGSDMTSSQDTPWPERLHLPGDESMDSWRSIELREDLYQWEDKYKLKTEDYEVIPIL